MRPWCITFLAVGPIAWNLSVCDVKADTPRTPNLDPLLDAIVMAESRSDSQAVGDGGRAIGPYQIHRDYWRDGTRILGVDWAYEDARDAAKAREVVRAYLVYYGKGKNLIDLARIHNGGPDGDKKASTLRYASKIAKVLAAQAKTAGLAKAKESPRAIPDSRQTNDRMG
jgi:hypothetical protein